MADNENAELNSVNTAISSAQSWLVELQKRRDDPATPSYLHVPLDIQINRTLGQLADLEARREAQPEGNV